MKCKDCGVIICPNYNQLCSKCKKEEGIGLMGEYNTLDEIIFLVRNIPNDMELGGAVRQLFSREKRTNTLEFKSIDKHHITGRGEVIIVKLQSDKSIVGETVIIDGEEYKVRGIEALGYLKAGKNVGLLVSKIGEKE
jgi:hypothetical protein